MKKFFSFVAIAATMLMASCTKEVLVEVPAEDQAANIEEQSVIDRFHDGVGAIALTIASPSSLGTRAIGDYGTNYGEFNDGEAYEHTVETAVLVLFKGQGDNELAYTLHSAYELKNTSWDPQSSNNQVTKSGKIVQKIERGGLVDGDKLYALVILNKHNYFTVDADKHELKYGSEVLNTKPLEYCGTLLLDESNRNFAAQSFFMSNMPYTTTPGGSSAPTSTVKILYPVDNASIYPSETDALAGSAITTINVERALAKVEVTSSSNTFTTTDGQDSEGEVLGWFIDNTNPKTYAVRHSVEPVDAPYSTSAYGYLGYKSQFHETYRFVSEFPVVAGKNWYRTFWAVDQNYNTPATGLTTKAGTIVDNTIMSYDGAGNLVSGNLRPVGKYYYCTENTFDIKHQSVKNTTRVVVAVKFNNGHDFYTVTPGETGVIWNVDDLKANIISQYLNRVYPAQWLDEYINGSVVTNPASLFEVTVTPNTTNGTATASIALKTLSLTQLKDGKTVNGATDAWNNNYEQSWINTNISLKYYKDGVCYYAALIQHFGESETPWTATASMENNTTAAGVYGTSSADYLGRYGVVRNNWYKVKLTGIRTLGTPTVPTLDGDEPDDQVEKFIKVEINIMPWAIRYQETTL